MALSPRSTSWSVKGIDPTTRELARDAAEREGLAIGVWIDRAILRQLGQADGANAAAQTPPSPADDNPFRGDPFRDDHGGPPFGHAGGAESGWPEPEPWDGSDGEESWDDDLDPDEEARLVAALDALNRQLDRSGDQIEQAVRPLDAAIDALEHSLAARPTASPSAAASPAGAPPAAAPPGQHDPRMNPLVAGAATRSADKMAGGGQPPDRRGGDDGDSGRLRRIAMILFTVVVAVAAITLVMWLADSREPPALNQDLTQDSTATEPAAGSSAAASGQSVPVPAPPAPAVIDPSTPGIASLLAAAGDGRADAQYLLASRYATGDGIPQDYDEAARWFREAALAGHPDAQFSLGVLYQNGLGVGQDSTEAIIWFLSAAEIGHAEAQHNMGVAYSRGIGVPQNMDQAVKWFRRAAAQGLATAQFNLGAIYDTGLNGAADPVQAYAWFSRAAEAGHPDAGIRAQAVMAKLNPADLDRAMVLASGDSIPLDSGPGTARLSREDVVEMQTLLATLGFDPGSTDGQVGPATEAAIREFQKVADLPVTGIADSDLLRSLRDLAGP
ncbi:MAG: SEL1-like repeat protein [Alphaproteobacteria bacterium]